MPRLLISVVLLVLVAGCGGGSSSSSSSDEPKTDPEAIRTLYREYAGAVADHDGDRACAAMTPGLRKSFETAIKGFDTEGRAGSDCGTMLKRITESARGIDDVMQALEDATVEDLRIAGGKAKFKVRIAINGKTMHIPGEATKAGAEWRMSCCLGPGPG